MRVKEFNKLRGDFKYGTFSEASNNEEDLKSVEVTTESIMAVQEELIEMGIEYEEVYRLTQEPITNTYRIEIYLEDD